MEQEELQIGDRVIILEHGVGSEGFYGNLEEIDNLDATVKLYDGRKAFVHAGALQKVSPYDIQYVMPGDVLRDRYAKPGRYTVEAVLDNLVFLQRANDYVNNEVLSLTRRGVNVWGLSIDKPVGVESEGKATCQNCNGKGSLGCVLCSQCKGVGRDQEGEWETVTVGELKKGDKFKFYEESPVVDVIEEPIKTDVTVAYKAVNEESQKEYITTRDVAEEVFRKKLNE